MKRGERVRVELSADSEFQGRTGTVDADSLDGWVQVSFDDEAISHQFRSARRDVFSDATPNATR